MKFFTDIINRLFIHWQSSVLAVVLGTMTLVFYRGNMTVQEYAMSLGAAVTLWAAISKDPDKTQTKPEVKEKEIKP